MSVNDKGIVDTLKECLFILFRLKAGALYHSYSLILYQQLTYN